MPLQKQFAILDGDGNACGSVWATSVELQDPTDPNSAWFFYQGSRVVASAWDGYKDIEAKLIVLRKKASQPNADPYEDRDPADQEPDNDRSLGLEPRGA